MPFSFQLLLEFFLPGMVLCCAGALLLDLAYADEIAAAMKFLVSGPSAGVAVAVFGVGLICYFLGTVANAVSNRVIRILLAGYRRKLIRRKLGLGCQQGPGDLPNREKQILEQFLPPLRCGGEDALNELYAAARSFCSLWSERTARAIDYHWSLVRLARATLLPLMLLAVVFLLRLTLATSWLFNAMGLVVSTLLLGLTCVTYSYREKFLIYTVFDVFFVSAKQAQGSRVAGGSMATHHCA